MREHPLDPFEKVAKDQRRPGLVSDFWHFLRATKKWWLLPLIVILLTCSLVMLLSGTVVAPFIYTLF